VVLHSEWRQAYRKALENIEAELRGTVNAVAAEQARTYRPAARNASAKALDEALWRALSELAQNPGVKVSETQWEDEQSFSFAAIAAKLPDVDESALRAVLNALTATSVLCAHAEKTHGGEQQYGFAHNLFPSYLFLTRQFSPAQAE
jgi:hypothetical protein